VAEAALVALIVLLALVGGIVIGMLARRPIQRWVDRNDEEPRDRLS
jgi:uncharacterized protein YneF (UPF0154 family)